jgi:hypothetical protein
MGKRESRELRAEHEPRTTASSSRTAITSRATSLCARRLRVSRLCNRSR